MSLIDVFAIYRIAVERSQSAYFPRWQYSPVFPGGVSIRHMVGPRGANDLTKSPVEILFFPESIWADYISCAKKITWNL